MASCASATPAAPRSTTSAPCTMPAFGPSPWRPTCSSLVATSALARWPASLPTWMASRLRASLSRPWLRSRPTRSPIRSTRSRCARCPTARSPARARFPTALPRRAARAAPSSRISLPIWRLLTRAATRTRSTSSSSATPCRLSPAPSARIPAAVLASVRSTSPRVPRSAPASSRPPARP